jgi:hypothetical protein
VHSWKPRQAEGGEAAKKHVFRQVRDAIRKQVLDFVAGWEDSKPEVTQLEFVMQGV